MNDNETAPYQDNGFKEETRLTTAEYTYDDNGNMITDLNKNLVVDRYNFLNLPEQIEIAMNGLNHINYLYDVAGTKLARQTVEEGIPDEEITTYYIGSFVYEDGELQYLLTSEGRVVFNLDGTHEYQYFLKDHLGNTRVTFGEDGIIQEDSYYPFGMLERSGNPAIAGTMAGLSAAIGMDLPNKYLYNAEKPEISDFIVFRASSKNHKKQSFFIFRDGKELQDDFGLDWYDYGARFYDPVIGRWHMVDEKANIYYSLNPYNYAGNNPINAIDIDGKLFIFVNGFMLDHWLAGKEPKQRFDLHLGGFIDNPDFTPYNPNRGFFSDGPRNNNTVFSYWENVDKLYMDAYKDNKAYYTNGSFTPKSTAEVRFNEGRKAALELIKMLENRDITLDDGETIKIVGHSHGAAYAAGLTSTLLKHSSYGALIEFTDYIAAMQPTDFEHPKGALGRQFLTWSDWVVNGTIPFIADSENGCIKGVSECNERKSYRGGRGGHSVNTYLNYLIFYFRSLGIPVNVVE